MHPVIPGNQSVNDLQHRMHFSCVCQVVHKNKILFVKMNKNTKN